jgi:hypothetical protein
MPQVERLANLGYCAMKAETTKGTPVIPNVFFHLFKESLTTDLNLDFSESISGQKHKFFASFQGMRAHSGGIEVLAEPNTAQHPFSMLMTPGSITGGGPYTHPFTISPTTNPTSYSVDLLKGQIVHRFWGVEASDIEPSFEKNKMHLNLGVAALGSLFIREIASVSTVTITLKTDYDFAPNKGFLATDVVRLMKTDGTTLDTTVSTVNADGITLVLGASAASFAAGDIIFLRAQTPSFSTLTPFEWGRTELRFSAAASDALTATKEPAEEGSKWKIMHEFESKEGAQRAGARDPGALVRARADATLNYKRFLDYGDDVNRFLKNGARACVIRHFSESGYELRITMNSLVAKDAKTPLETGKIIYQEYDYQSVYNTSDGQAFDVKILNNLAS